MGFVSVLGLEVYGNLNRLFLKDPYINNLNLQIIDSWLIRVFITANTDFEVLDTVQYC